MCMKKGILVSILLLCITWLTLSVSASNYVLSSEYTDNTSCQNDVTKYNVDFPDYVRSSCFINNWKYYYKICQKWDTCTDSNTNVTTQNGASIQSTYLSWSTNSYSATLSTSLKTKIDQKIVTVLKNAKDTYSKNEYKVILTNFLTKLSGLEARYNSNTTIKNLVWYIKFEVEKIFFELEEDSVDDFICELMWNCNTATNNTTANITISITINQWIFYCWDPNRNDYTTYSPINKIVLLNNDIITHCTTKWGKAWTKSTTGTIENLKNISDVKNGDVFTTGTTSTTNNSTSSSTSSSGSSPTANECWIWKKKVWEVCITDTASVNPSGNYTLWKWACVSHIWTDVWYDWNSYTKAINGQTHWIWKTLNKCIESCDIGDINIGLNKASCFYEWKVIRSAGSSTITNITSGTIINTWTTTTTNNLTNEKFYVSAASTSTGTLVNFKIDKEYGYKVCVMTAWPDTDMFSILADGTTMSRSWNSTGLWSKLKADGTFEWTLYYGPTAWDLYLNLYCSTIVWARYSDLTKIIPSTKISNIITAPIITRTISNMPSDQITSTNTSTPTSTTGTCIATTINWYTLPDASNGSVKVISKVVSGSNYEQEFKCDWTAWNTRGTEINKTPTYTQAQVDAAIADIIKIHWNTTEAINVLVDGILKLESEGAIGLRQQVANYLKVTLEQVNEAINTYK